MGCCLSRNKNHNPVEEFEEREVVPNAVLRRYLNEKDTALEGPQTGVPSKRNNNSVMEDYCMPKANPIMEDSFLNNLKKPVKKYNLITELSVSRESKNNSSFLEIDEVSEDNNEFQKKYNKNNILKKPNMNRSMSIYSKRIEKVDNVFNISSY